MRILVVGGGKVGTKRALKFREYGADVTVVSLSFSDELSKREDIRRIELDAREVDQEFLRDYDIVVTATNSPELNSRICDLCRKARKLCNNPTNPPDSSFIVPIFYEDEDIGIAVTTMGKSSIMSKVILDRALEAVREDPRILLELKVMSDVKAMLKRRVSDPGTRYTLYQKIFVDREFESFINNGNVSNALKRAEEIVNEHSQ